MSSMAFGGGLAGVARVAFEATTGEFNADTRASAATYREATRDMSDDAIRLELSQSKLHRELAKGPGNYERIAKAELEVRRSEAALRMENERLERSFRDTGRTLDRAGRGALLGSGAFRGLARSVTFASASFLGGAGLVYGMRQALNVASNLEEQQNATRVVFKESADTVLDWSKTTVTSIGIARDQALEYAGSIGGIANASGLTRRESAELSKSIVQLAADLASAKNADPSDMLERLRSGLVGEAEPLRRFGVLLSAAAVEEEAVRLGLAKVGEELTEGEKVQARYSIILKQTADIQGDYANTSDSLANSQRTLSGLWREAQGLVGQALAPAYTDAVQALRDWLSEEENQEELQRRVNKLVGDAEAVVRGFAAGLKVAKAAADPLISALGGLENAVKTVTLLWLGFKAKALLGFAGTALASRTTSAKLIADATAAGRAWDIATRPRNLIVTTTGGGVPGGGTPTGGGRGRSRLPGMAGTRGAGLVGAAGFIAAGVVIGDALAPPSLAEQQRRVADLSRVDRRRALELAQEFASEFGTNIDDLVTSNPLLRRYGKPLGPAAPPSTGQPMGEGRDRPNMGRTVPSTSRGGGRGGQVGGDGLSPLQRATLAAQAATTPEGELAAERAILAIYERQERNTKATGDKLFAIRQRTIEQRQRVRAIEEQIAADRKADIEERAAAREKAAEERRAAREKAAKKLAAAEARERAEIERDYRNDLIDAGAGIRNPNLVRGPGGRRRSTIMRKAGIGGEETEQTFTLAQIRQMQLDFLHELRGLGDRFGGNLLPGGAFDSMGQLGTHAVIQTDLLREQNSLVKRLASTASHPGARYAHTEMAAAFGAVGF